MQLKNLLTEDDAVSPVIGVILMVAITVILAAVIASFVLGLGETTSETPTASFSFGYDDTVAPDPGGVVTVTHDSGDPIPAENIVVRGEKLNDEGAQWLDLNNANVGSNTRVVAGNSADVEVSGDDYVLNVIYEDGDATTTLQTDEGPAA